MCVEEQADQTTTNVFRTNGSQIKYSVLQLVSCVTQLLKNSNLVSKQSAKNIIYISIMIFFTIVKHV